VTRQTDSSDIPRSSRGGALSRLLALAARFETLWRYYGVGLLNTAFGYGLFAGLVWLHLNIFAAQILAHVSGATFNYFMFRRLVFTGSRPAVLRYIGSYAINYLIGLGFLAAARLVIASPYLDGLVAIVCTSIVNYVILKRFVFGSPPAGKPDAAGNGSPS
jgi:putative flippase GtrA